MALDADPSRKLLQRSRKVGECADPVSRVVPPVLSSSRHRTRGRDTGDGWDSWWQGLIQGSWLPRDADHVTVYRLQNQHTVSCVCPAPAALFFPAKVCHLRDTKQRKPAQWSTCHGL